MSFSIVHRHFLLFILISSVLNLLQIITFPLIDDEAYYWVWSNNLDFGYFDHPPMVAVFIKIGYSITNSILGVRLLSLVSSILFYIIWYKILNPKTMEQFYLFFGLFASAGVFQAMGFISTPDVPLMLFGSYFILKLINFIENQNPINSILFGISMALVMYSKYHGALLIFFAIIPFFLYFYNNKWFYISILIALILFSPHIIWQYNHDWVSIKYHLFGRNKKEIKGFLFGEWLLGLVGVLNPLLLRHYFNGVWGRSNNDWINALKIVFIGILVIFIFISFKVRIQPQWNLIIAICLIPITYMYYKNRITKNILKLSYYYLGFLVLVRILFLIPYFIQLTPMYELKQFVLKCNEVTKGIPVFERYQKAALFNFYNQKQAECLQVYVHRKSQYDIWNSEEKIQNKEITFFGLEGVSDNFIINEDDKKEFYKTIDSFVSYPKITCIINPKNLKIDDSIQLINISWFNHDYDNDILISNNSNLEAGIMLFKSKNLEPILYFPIDRNFKIPRYNKLNSDTLNMTMSQKNKISNFKLYGFHSEINIPLDIRNIPKERYKVYVVLKPYGISGKVISNEIIIE